MNPYIYEIRKSLSQMPEEERTVDGLMRIVGGITMSTVNLLQSNWTIGLQMKQLKRAYKEIEQEV